MFSSRSRERSGAFSMTIHDSAAEFRLVIRGNVTANEAKEVEQCWHTAESIIGRRSFVVDVSGVAAADAEIADLLARMDESGARFMTGCLRRSRAGIDAGGCEPVRVRARTPGFRSKLLAHLLLHIPWLFPAQQILHRDGVLSQSAAGVRLP